jgi:hypothetical protein
VREEETRPVLWRFDAWDARAGLAFASYRPADDFEQGHLNLDFPTVFLGPPIFQPEQLESRALALAACRGTFQQGWFLGGRELGFDELSDLIVEVRRAYFAGSVIDHGDDGGGGNTQSPPVTPSEGGLGGGDNREFPSKPEQTSLRKELEEIVTRFSLEIKELGETEKIGETGEVPSAKFDWPALLEAEPTGGDDIVERGGLLIASELLARYQPDGSRPNYHQWAEASGRFARACGVLRLWKAWSANGHISALLKSAPHLLRELAGVSPTMERMSHHAREGDEIAGSLILWWLLVPEERDDVEWNYELFYHYRGRYMFWTNEYLPAAPLQDLGYWPIPQELGRLANPNYPSRASVADLLAMFLACPQKFSDAGNWQLWATLEICLFAAAYLTHRDSPLPITLETDKRALWRPRNFEFHQPAMALGKAWRWLSKQLPTVAFVPEVEEMILQGATLSYRKQIAAEPALT